MTAPCVVLATGHMVDLPDRVPPRFPTDQVPRVTAEVRDVLAAWQVGAGSTVVCGGARGADLIIAEEALARGARVVLCLALPPEEFARRSVDVPGTDWAARFHRVAGRAEVRVLDGGDGGGPDDVFARTNAWMVDVARSIDPHPYAIVVWDGCSGDGPGGTADMIGRLGAQGADPRVRVIDPGRRGGDVGNVSVTAPGRRPAAPGDGGTLDGGAPAAADRTHRGSAAPGPTATGSGGPGPCGPPAEAVPPRDGTVAHSSAQPEMVDPWAR